MSVLDGMPRGLDPSGFTRWHQRANDPCESTIDVKAGNLGMNVEIDAGADGFLRLAIGGFAACERAGSLVLDQGLHTLMEMAWVRDDVWGIATDLRPGAFRFPHCKVSMSASRTAVGMEFIRRLRFIIDVKQSAIFLKPGGDFLKFDQPAQSGVRFHLVDGRAYLTIVADSIAARCGLCDGFRVLEVQGIPIQRLGFFHAYDLLHDCARTAVSLRVVANDDRDRVIAVSDQAKEKDAHAPAR